MANDMGMLSIALWAAYSLRLSHAYVPDSTTKWVLLSAAPLIGFINFHMRGLHTLATRFTRPSGAPRIYIAVVIAVLIWALVVLMSGVKGHPRSVVVIYGLIAAGVNRVSLEWVA